MPQKHIRSRQSFPLRTLARRIALTVFTCMCLAIFHVDSASSSSWGPVLLVNTEGFQVLDDSDTAADLKLRFGDTVSEEIYWSRSNARFDFTDDINTTGNITASGTLIVSGNAATKSDLTLNSDNGAADAVLTFGNSTLAETLKFLTAESRFEFSDDARVLNNLTISGTVVADGSVRLKSGLRVTGVISGAYVHATQGISTSGTLMISTPKIANTNTWGSGALIVQQRVETATGAYMYSSGAAVLALDTYERTARNPHLLFGYKGTFDTNLYRSSGSTLRTDDSLVIDGKLGLGTGNSRLEAKAEIVGTLSGQILHGQDELRSSGSLIVETTTTLNGALDHNGSTVGFYGVAPVARPSAYTQTYSTADKTHANSTFGAVSETAATNTFPFGYDSAQQADSIPVELNDLADDVSDLKQLVNAIIDDLQGLGLGQ